MISFLSKPLRGENVKEEGEKAQSQEMQGVLMLVVKDAPKMHGGLMPKLASPMKHKFASPEQMI